MFGAHLWKMGCLHNLKRTSMPILMGIKKLVSADFCKKLKTELLGIFNQNNFLNPHVNQKYRFV